MGWGDEALEVCRAGVASAFGGDALLVVGASSAPVSGILRWVDDVSATGVLTRREVYDVADEILAGVDLAPTSDPDTLTTIAIDGGVARLVLGVERGPQGTQRLRLGREVTA